MIHRIHLNYIVNVSVQIGDMIYISLPYKPGTTPAAALLQDSPRIEVGIVRQVGEYYVDVELSASFTMDPQDIVDLGYHIMFSKNKSANTSGLLGYYMDVNFVNNSRKKAELYTVGSDVTINS